MSKRGYTLAQDKYFEDVHPYLKEIEKWCGDGATNEDIWTRLKIGKTTFYTYMKKYPELKELLKRTKDVVDGEVENALFKRAMGYEYDEITVETDEQGREKTKVIKKQIAADVTAQIFWLKNRQPAKWRDKQDVDIQGGVNIFLKPTDEFK